jgi:parallel beta-helix repeat protein
MQTLELLQRDRHPDQPEGLQPHVDFKSEEAQSIFQPSSSTIAEKDMTDKQLQRFFEGDPWKKNIFSTNSSDLQSAGPMSMQSNSTNSKRDPIGNYSGLERSPACFDNQRPSSWITPQVLKEIFADLDELESIALTDLNQLTGQTEAAPDAPISTAAPAGSDSPTSTTPPAASDAPTSTTPPAASDSPTGTTPPASSDSPTSAAPPPGSDAPTSSTPPPGSDAPISTAPPAASDKSTPTDAASALAGFQLPELSGPVFTPQFGNGVSDTQAIQNAVDQASAAGGGLVQIPAGTYNIDAADDGVVMKSNVSLVMEQGAVLQAIPNTSESGCIIDIRDVNNVNIYGGKLVGDYPQDPSLNGETMSGIDILGSSSNINIMGVESDENKGDGFDVAGNGSNITLAHDAATGNKRDGLSIEGGTNVTAEYDAFVSNGNSGSYDDNVPAASRLPVSGIDIENQAGLSNNDITVENNLLADNGTPSIDAGTSNGWGIRVTGSDGNNSQIIDNTITGNAGGGVGVWTGSGNIVSDNTIESQSDPYTIFGGSASGSGNTLDGVPLNVAY